VNKTLDSRKHLWYQAPLAFCVAALVCLLTLSAFSLPTDSIWTFLLQPLYTALLFRRRVLELIILSIIALGSNYTAQAFSGLGIGQDLLFGLAIAVILCPKLIQLCGFKEYNAYS
jgi:hypothetical protein